MCERVCEGFLLFVTYPVESSLSVCGLLVTMLCFPQELTVDELKLTGSNRHRGNRILSPEHLEYLCVLFCFSRDSVPKVPNLCIHPVYRKKSPSGRLVQSVKMCSSQVLIQFVTHWSGYFLNLNMSTWNARSNVRFILRIYLTHPSG